MRDRLLDVRQPEGHPGDGASRIVRFGRWSRRVDERGARALPIVWAVIATVFVVAAVASHHYELLEVSVGSSVMTVLTLPPERWQRVEAHRHSVARRLPALLLASAASCVVVAVLELALFHTSLVLPAATLVVAAAALTRSRSLARRR